MFCCRLSHEGNSPARATAKGYRADGLRPAAHRPRGWIQNDHGEGTEGGRFGIRATCPFGFRLGRTERARPTHGAGPRRAVDSGESEREFLSHGGFVSRAQGHRCDDSPDRGFRVRNSAPGSPCQVPPSILPAPSSRRHDHSARGAIYRREVRSTDERCDLPTSFKHFGRPTLLFTAISFWLDTARTTL
jgi:hypothetical protein